MAEEPDTPIAVHYALTAATGSARDLEDALQALSTAVRALSGSDGVDLLRDRHDPARFLFIERWASPTARADAGRTLGKDAFAAVFASLAEKPEVRVLDRPGIPRAR